MDRLNHRMKIRDHHQRTIDNLANAYMDDSDYIGLIIGGSVAKGCARADSDVDFMIVATDEVFDHRLASQDFFINRTDLADYAGGYVDGKIINLAFLKNVAEKGNEPSRAAFEGAFLAFSRIDDLDTLLQQIHAYPEDGHDQRIRAFYTMAFMQNWLMVEAQRHDNRYTMTRAASQLTLFAGRLILAHNRCLFPFHKWLLRALDSVAEKPADLMTHFAALLEVPSVANATALFECVRNFRDWGVSDLDAYTWFMTDVEWSWMNGTTPIEDW